MKDYLCSRQKIAIVPTACGIETEVLLCPINYVFSIAIVPTACGIETFYKLASSSIICYNYIAIVPTACGIETLAI